MRRFFAAALLLLMAAAVVSAQDVAAAPDKAKNNEVAFTIGRTFIADRGGPNPGVFDNTVHSGKGLSFDISYARVFRRYKWGSLSGELPLLWNPDEDLNYGLNQVPEAYRSMFLTPAVRARFLEGFAFQPWVSFGAGLGRFVASENMVFFGPNTGHRIKTTGTLDGAFGLDVPLGRKFNNAIFRFEARDNWSGQAPININTGKTRQHNIYVGGGVVFAF